MIDADFVGGIKDLARAPEKPEFFEHPKIADTVYVWNPRTHDLEAVDVSPEFRNYSLARRRDILDVCEANKATKPEVTVSWEAVDVLLDKGRVKGGARMSLSKSVAMQAVLSILGSNSTTPKDIARLCQFELAGTGFEVLGPLMKEIVVKVEDERKAGLTANMDSLGLSTKRSLQSSGGELPATVKMKHPFFANDGFTKYVAEYELGLVADFGTGAFRISPIGEGLLNAQYDAVGAIADELKVDLGDGFLVITSDGGGSRAPGDFMVRQSGRTLQR